MNQQTGNPISKAIRLSSRGPLPIALLPVGLLLASLLVVGLLLGMGLLSAAEGENRSAAVNADGSSSRPDSRDSAVSQPTRLREGSQFVDRRGRFEITGDRVTFYPRREEGKEVESYRVLENLALERVVRVLSESPTRRQWLISGTITEFQGANFLLLQRAYITSSIAPKTKP